MANKYSEAGKGSTPKLKQKKSFDSGWDRIWGSKENHKEDNIFYDSDETVCWDEDKANIIGINSEGDHYIK